MPAESDDTARKFGAEVRRLRAKAGHSQTYLASKIPLAQSTMSGIERGRWHAKKYQAERIDQALNSGGQVVALWESYYDGYQPPDWYRQIPEMEQRSTQIQDYQALVITGLLQTESYARATIRAGDRMASEEETQAKVRARLERQEILLSEDAPFLVAVLDQAVLHRRLGSPEIMKGQLDHLRQASLWERVEVLIVPSNTWNSPGVNGGFRLLKVPEAGTILYQETGAVGGVVVDPTLVEEHIALMSDLRALALPPDQSRALIESVQGEFE